MARWQMRHCGTRIFDLVVKVVSLSRQTTCTEKNAVFSITYCLKSSVSPGYLNRPLELRSLVPVRFSGRPCVSRVMRSLYTSIVPFSPSNIRHTFLSQSQAQLN